ncbi:Fanconi anaemia protein FANCD2 [Chlamydoabsidia padenii]|nr:Fanconi anaemia protein FANCD2 [Chlamydoabsidia padenii]
MTNSFVELVKTAGCEYDNDTNSFVFTVEPSLFRRHLTLNLRSDPNYPDNISSFFDDLQEYTTDVSTFRRCLLSATVSDTVPRTNKSSTVDSLFKTLLAIDILQPILINNLLERLPEFYDELEQDQSSSCTARLILHQLRWLDYIVQPEELTNTLIEIIQITPNIIQHEIITSLPDMLNDAEHKPIVVFLKEWMQQHSDLAVPILDALSNLSLHSEYLEDVRETVLERLQSAEIDDLAVIVKFLLQTVTPHTIDMTILDIRQKLDLRALGKVQQSNLQSSQQVRDHSKPSPEALILDSIKLGLQFHKFVCDAWVKAILALETKRAHKVIDILVLFILYSMTSMKKKTEQIFRKKVQSGLITPALIKETLLCHANGLSSYWPSILSLSENLLRASHQLSVLAPCSQALYIHAFQVCDSYNRQEIIGALVTHIGSGSAVEMDVALDVLLDLAQKNAAMVAVYNVFIKGVLDYLDNLTLSQTRTLFDIFSILALKVDTHYSNDSSLWSDIQIVLRKQLSNPRVKYKRIGIVGSLSAVKVLADRGLCNDAAGSSSQSSVSAESISRHPLLQQAVNLLEMMVKSCVMYPTCISMVYDEMAVMIESSNLDHRLYAWISDNLTVSFIDDYVIDEEAYLQLENDLKDKSSVGLKPKMVMDHNGESSTIYMMFYSLIHGVNDKRRKKQIIPLCSIFNLMQSCEKAADDTLEGVDALLGCGFAAFDLDNTMEFLPNWQTDEAEDACHMIFMAIDWSREILNCFSVVSEDEDIHTKLIQRLKDILHLERIMEKLLPKVPSFTPLHLQSTLSLYTDGNDTRSTQTQIIQSQSQQGDDSESEKAVKTTSRFDTVESLRRFMRPLKIQVLAILKAPNDDDDSAFDYEDSNYILKDINGKLDAKIVPPATGFGKKKTTTKNLKDDTLGHDLLTRMSARQVMNEMIKYLPKILQTLEAVYEEMQSDGTQYGRISPGSEASTACISLNISILYKLFMWPDLDNPDNHDIMMNLINTLSERLTADGSQHSDMDRAKGAMRYLSGFQEHIPQFPAAVSLFKILEQIMVLSGNSAALRVDAHHVASSILSRDWIDWRDAKKDIPYLVEKVIELENDPLKILVHYVNKVLPAFEKGERLEFYPLLKSETVVPFYQAIINQTIKSLDLLEKTDQDTNVVLVQIAQVVNIFEKITSYVKMKEQRVLFGVLLKTSRVFIQQFTKYSIPFLSRVFKDHKDEIVAIFKQLQIGTRLLQIICSHVKVIKDVQLATYVPPLKKALEVVIFQVKMLLMDNHAPSDAFFLGALKHRDISGAQVSSQIPKDISSDSEDQLSDGEPPAPRPSKPKRMPARSKQAPQQPYRTSSQVPSSSDEEDYEDAQLHESSIGSDDNMLDDEGDNNNDAQRPTNEPKKRAGPMDFNSFNRFLDDPEDNQQPQPPRKQKPNLPVSIFSSEDEDDDNDSMVIRADSTDDGYSTPTPEKTDHRIHKDLAPTTNHQTTSSRPEKRGMKRSYGLGMTRKRSKH